MVAYAYPVYVDNEEEVKLMTLAVDWMNRDISEKTGTGETEETRWY